MNKILILFFFIFTANIVAKEVLVNITGIAKVGKECFLNLSFQNESTLLIENVNLLVYSFDKNNLLLGKSEVILNKIRKKQPYKIFTSVEMTSVRFCEKIKKIDLVVTDCFSKSQEKIKTCNNFFRIDDKKSVIESLEVSISENTNYYIKNINKDFFIPELNVSLKVLDIETAERYKIRNYKNGLVVINKDNNFFKEGDLIIEAEMNSIFKIKDLNEKIKLVKNNKKKSILISLVRKQEEKFVAVFLK
ncbi:MAG: hypothetical protein CMJ08_00255 [Pelagibacterales bacterium]|nr:hypothetical protein [Pelagibacterales bacterium]|tara:strand:- start:5628 stop:6371 length:744 start_codon:yes stop_codon:yes gene_type:complete